MNQTFKILIFLSLIISFNWYIFSFEPNNIQVEELTIKIENLPQSFDGAKIVHLTDFHSKNFGEREKRVLQIVEQLNPDFVFITGDFIDHRTKDIKSCQEFWRELGKKYKKKIYGVLGNHEYDNPEYSSSIEQTINKSGIVILSNKNKKIFLGDQYIYLIGVDDPDTGHDNLPKAMSGVENNMPKILLAHSPEIIGDITEKNIDLILAGHTHGGQVKIPFMRPFWVPTKYHGKYASGLFKISSTYLYVNRGVGTTLLPIRFNCPPEITLIELKS